MRRRKLWLNIISVAIVIICSAGVGAAMKANSSNELMIAVVSLGVALIALYISLRTFYSIDEVNAISRMDGNVMENPRYRPNLLRAIFRFRQTGFSETSEALMSYMERLFKDKGKQSGAHLSDHIQEVADMMVLVPFFIQTSDQKSSAMHIQRVNRLLQVMRIRIENFKEISDGSSKLLEETYNLIDSVFAYQKMTANGSSNPSKLLEIRGSIFINPVACILYNNYIGLYYLQRATSLLCAHQTGLSLKQQIEAAADSPIEDKSFALVYVDKALKSFKRAKENIGDDMIWNAFVCFNIARTEYMQQQIRESYGNPAETQWEQNIDESIRSWITSNKIIAEHFSAPTSTGQVTWLQQALISQENKVRLSKVVFQMLRHQTLTDYNGNHWVENYSGIIETDFFKNIPTKDPQNRTDSLVADIRELIQNNK